MDVDLFETCCGGRIFRKFNNRGKITLCVCLECGRMCPRATRWRKAHPQSVHKLKLFSNEFGSDSVRLPLANKDVFEDA